MDKEKKFVYGNNNSGQTKILRNAILSNTQVLPYSNSRHRMENNFFYLTMKKGNEKVYYTWF